MVLAVGQQKPKSLVPWLRPDNWWSNSSVKKVRHPTGGVVRELRVRDGDRVNAGDILVRLDDTQTRANLAIVIKALDENAARQAREEAERDGADTVVFPQDLIDRMHSPDVERAVNGERKQFETRRSARDGQRSQLRERIVQLNDEMRGYQAQIVSKDSQLAWITKELEGVNDLWQKNLVPYTRVTALERDKDRLDGERGSSPFRSTKTCAARSEEPGRDPRQDRRARRKEGGSGRSTQASGHSRAACRRGPPARR